MSFSDAKLKELKDLLDDPQASGFFTEEMARGILARLDAVETVCNLLVGPGVIHPFVKAWRRSAGK